MSLINRLVAELMKKSSRKRIEAADTWVNEAMRLKHKCAEREANRKNKRKTPLVEEEESDDEEFNANSGDWM